MKSLNTALILTVAMAITAASASHLKPSIYLSDTRSNLKIEPSIPIEFGEWKMAPVSGSIVNPQQEQQLQTLYSEIITRTYVGSEGQRVMLTIAYGKNQSDSFQAHKPEICYPAQGFELKSNVQDIMQTAVGQVPVRRIETILGRDRFEPVTYWMTIGDYAVKNGIEKKIKEIDYSFKGYIADGLLFRISSIDPDSSRAFKLHAHFADDLLTALHSDERKRLAGIAP